MTILDDYTFTCGATLSDLELSSSLSEVCIRDSQCYDPLEKQYYSMKYDPICVHCCSEDNISWSTLNNGIMVMYQLPAH